MIEGLAVGRIVHYVLADSDLPEKKKHNIGEHRAAVIARDFQEGAGTVNLVVFVDGSNDLDNDSCRLWATSRTYDESRDVVRPVPRRAELQVDILSAEERRHILVRVARNRHRPRRSACLVRLVRRGRNRHRSVILAQLPAGNTGAPGTWHWPERV